MGTAESCYGYDQVARTLIMNRGNGGEIFVFTTQNNRVKKWLWIHKLLPKHRQLPLVKMASVAVISSTSRPSLSPE